MKRKPIKANDTRTMKVVIGLLLLWAEFKWPQGHQKWWRTGGRDLLKSCLSVKTPNYQQEADSKDHPRSNNLGPWFCCCCLVDKSCPSLCDPMDCSPPGSSVHGICQARILEWGATSFSGGSSQSRDRTCISCTDGKILYSWTTCEAPVNDSAAAAAAAKSLQLCPTLCHPIDGSPPRLLRPWDSPGKNTGVGCRFLLQCIKVSQWL